MRIGELAGRVGITTRALRHYEEQGLLRAHRASNGYRLYDERVLRLVGEIRGGAHPYHQQVRSAPRKGEPCPRPRRAVSTASLR